MTDSPTIAPPIRTTQEAMETAKVLLDYGADINAKNKDGYSLIEFIDLFIPEFENRDVFAQHPDSTTAIISPVIEYLEETLGKGGAQ